MSSADFLDDVRAFYDELAVDYHHLMGTDLAELPFERDVLRAFVDVVGPGAVVLDAGCGPGRVTAYLASLGLDCRGIDLSESMVTIARQSHPGLSFEVGNLAELDVPDASFDGLLAWYSLIHVPERFRGDVLAGFRRVLRPGGHLLLAFQEGDEIRHFEAPDGRRSADGRVVGLDFHRLSPDALRTDLADAGFTVLSGTLREARGRETRPQASLLARRD